jgi:hypothetical protein
MARPDLLGDDFEGTTPAAEAERWRTWAKEAESDDQRQTIEGNAEQIKEFARTRPRQILCQLLAYGQRRNIAMWDRYVKTTR